MNFADSMNFVGALIVIGFAFHVALRMRARNPKDAFLGIAGYYVTFYLVTLFGSTLLPKQIISVERQVNDNWTQVFDHAASTGGLVGKTIYNYTGLGDTDVQSPTAVYNPQQPAIVIVSDAPTPVPATTTSYTVKPGDTLNQLAGEFGVSVDDLRMMNSLPGDLIVVGQELQIATSPTPAPIVQASTPAPMIAPTIALFATVPVQEDPSVYYDALGSARYNGDINEGTRLVNTILQINPTDEVALAEASNIQAAQEKSRIWGILEQIETSTSVDDEVAERTAQALAGLTYEIVDDGAGFLKPLCSEFATIKVTEHGWLWDERIIVPRCYLAELYNVVTSGDKFSTR